MSSITTITTTPVDSYEEALERCHQASKIVDVTSARVSDEFARYNSELVIANKHDLDRPRSLDGHALTVAMYVAIDIELIDFHINAVHNQTEARNTVINHMKINLNKMAAERVEFETVLEEIESELGVPGNEKTVSLLCKLVGIIKGWFGWVSENMKYLARMVVSRLDGEITGE